MIPIEEHDDLLRDEKSRGIINTNRSAYKSRLNQLETQRKQREEIEQLKNDVGEIKDLLMTLLQNQQSK